MTQPPPEVGPRPFDATPMHLRDRRANYVTRPFVDVGNARDVTRGWADIGSRLARTGARVIVVEAYPGVRPSDLDELTRALGVDEVIDVETALLPKDALHRLLHPQLTDDPIFGRLTRLELVDLYDRAALAELRTTVAVAQREGRRVAIVGTGATLVVPGDLTVLADLPRWEIQQRQRRHESGNLGAFNADQRPSLLYKRGYFVDWRVADRVKKALLPTVDFLLDTTRQGAPKMITGDLLRRGLTATVHQPFRVAPFFDPGPWGGQWIKEVCDLDREAENYAWAFDCVPEENSLLLGFGEHRIEVPSLDLMMHAPSDFIGEGVRDQLGDEFPIRFDFLDTIDGGNLSLQVHPVTEYMREQFGHTFTQDESYYYLDAVPDEATVYLGVRDDVDRHAMRRDLEIADDGGPVFDAEAYVNVFPAKRHDHVLIPAGTVHCSGRGGMVLEISATPYIFTFKLWDWNRLGLDGLPRPINIERGLDNLVWERDTRFTMEQLVNDITPIGTGRGWRSERTGLHETEFIDTVRHWFTETAPFDEADGVRVGNLVQGEEAIIASPDRAFEPYTIHYAETFIVPPAAGPYTVTPSRRDRDRHRDAGPESDEESGLLTAFVRGTA